MGLGDLQELRHDGRDAPEVGGALGGFEALRQRTVDQDGGVEAGRIHDGLRRQEHGVGARLPQQPEVGVEVAGVALQVLLGAELQRIEEDRDQRAVGFGAGTAQQRQVAVVQRAHGGDESDAAGLGTTPAARRRDRFEALHGVA